MSECEFERVELKIMESMKAYGETFSKYVLFTSWLPHLSPCLTSLYKYMTNNGKHYDKKFAKQNKIYNRLAI